MQSSKLKGVKKLWTEHNKLVQKRYRRKDGGLKDNFAAGIARRISRQIWPSKRSPAKLLSLGTGSAEDSHNNQSPFFQHIFRDGFLCRAFNSWMSSMDTESKWQEMFGQLDDSAKDDYIRFNVTLQGVSGAIDDVEKMDSYRNLVILQSGSAEMAREAASALLISRFYFVLDAWPQGTDNPFWCHGRIRCKTPIKSLLTAIERRHSQRLEYVTDSERLGRFLGQGDICQTCGRYCKKVSFLVRHPDDIVNIYLRADRQKRWRISGFPEKMVSFKEKQGLSSPFGRRDHGRPGTVPCDACDSLKRRKPMFPLSCVRARKRVRVVSDKDEGL